MVYRRSKLTIYLVTGSLSLAALATGTYALFTATSMSSTGTFAAGKLSITAAPVDNYGCAAVDGASSTQGSPSSQDSTAMVVGNLLPGKTSPVTQTLAVQNNGTLTAWVGLQASMPANLPLKAEYTVQVYQPNPQQATGSTGTDSGSGADSTGDQHSNCHTGSKFLGAGGNDKSNDPGASDKSNTQDTDDPTLIDTVTRSWFATLDASPQTPFLLPPGDYALVTFHYHLESKAPSSAENQQAVVNVSFQAVQARNNSGATGPNSWG